MNQKKISPGFHGTEISGELLTPPDNRNAGLNIRDLATRLLMNRKEALLLLVSLESQGVLTWDSSSKLYRANPESLRLRLQEEGRGNSKAGKTA